MDFDVVHALNGELARHDGLEDAIVLYERAGALLLVGLMLVLFVAVRGRSAVHVRRGLVAAAPAAGVALAAAHVVAGVAGRPRPFVAHPALRRFVAHAADPGFPSEHATGAFAIAVAVLLRSRGAGRVFVAIATAIAAGRVALGLHYPSDVLAGAALGAAVAWLLARGAPARATDRLADAAGAVADRLAAPLRGRRRPAWPGAQDRA